MCLNENPSQSSNIVRPAIWVLTSCEVTYISMEHHQLRGGTFVRTSSITKVEANHSSTGIRSGSHLPGRLEMLSALLSQPTFYTELENDNSTAKLIPDVADTVHLGRPNMIQSGKHLILLRIINLTF